MPLNVSAIVASRDRARLLEETLDALLSQQWPPACFEIIVADNGSTDDTRAIVEAAAAKADAPRVRYLFVAEPGKSNAVNAALAVAKGEVLAFTDDDVLPEPSWIARLVAAFEETGADFVAGRIFARWEEPPPPWMSPAFYGVLAIPDNGDRRLRIEPGVPTNVMAIGANMAIRRHVVARIGGLRADLGKLAGTLRTAEDHEFFLRMLHAGFRGVYEPTATVRHWVPRDRMKLTYVSRWLYQNGRDVARLERSYANGLRRWLGVPRYLWREAARDLMRTMRTTVTRDPRGRSASATRIAWFTGYVRETWARTQVAAPPLRPAEEGR